MSLTTDPVIEAFDALASQYDQGFSAALNPVVSLLRERVYQSLARHFSIGTTLLELGCGTGQDTLELTARGYRIVASDPSPKMIAEAKNKRRPGTAAPVFLCQGAAELAASWPSLGLAVDGVFSNFGPLNCELSLAPVRQLLENALRPGGRFVTVVLPRICPLEVALFLLLGEPRTALRRFRRNPTADVEGRRFPIRYYGAGDFDRALGDGFRRVETRSLGLFLPPPRFGVTFGKIPGLLAALSVMEDAVGGLPGARRMGDHVLLAYQRL
jgi:SAM-dependent methyltransferase